MQVRTEIFIKSSKSCFEANQYSKNLLIMKAKKNRFMKNWIKWFESKKKKKKCEFCASNDV